MNREKNELSGPVASYRAATEQLRLLLQPAFRAFDHHPYDISQEQSGEKFVEQRRPAQREPTSLFLPARVGFNCKLTGRQMYHVDRTGGVLDTGGR